MAWSRFRRGLHGAGSVGTGVLGLSAELWPPGCRRMGAGKKIANCGRCEYTIREQAPMPRISEAKSNTGFSTATNGKISRMKSEFTGKARGVQCVGRGARSS